MWVLETEGDALQGKKLWLPPGKKYIFGRTSVEGIVLTACVAGHFVIANKTISRQHLVVEVGSTASADGSPPSPPLTHDVNSRSTLTLTDLKTKIGTLVNGEQIRGKSHVVSGPDNVVTLGKYEYHFTFTWVPVNLTFSFTAKEARAGPFTALYERLGPFDIKVLPEFKRGITTHLVAKKRNTSKGLQALIDGKYIVHDDSYIKALVVACTAANNESKSPLEIDFDGNFPDPLEYLPPRGGEPTQRDASAYSPNPVRQNMFEGYTFVFYEKRQYENLQAPIFDGGGKAVIHDVVAYETTVEEFVGLVKKDAGEKGLGSFEDGSEGKGVVVVRFNPSEGTGSDWYTNFNNEVSLRLDHRLIMQNEFLDAILGTDASVLRRPLEFVQSGVVAPPSVETAISPQLVQRSPPRVSAASTAAHMAPPPQTTRRAASRRLNLDAINPGFDEEYNGPSAMRGVVPELVEDDPALAVEFQSQSLFVSQDTRGDREDELPTVTERSGRKRGTPPIDYEEDDEDIMDNVAPAAQAFKKRKLAAEAARRGRGESTPPPAIQAKRVSKSENKPTRVRKEINFEEVLVQKQAEDAQKAEELARAEREPLEETLDGLPIEDIRNLAIIEEMVVARRGPPPRTALHADESDRWDERWNGRRNFKKFRRRGADSNDRRGASRVIVQLEEVKKKDFGIGDEYWLEDADTQRRKKKGKGKNTQDTQSQARQRQRPQARTGRSLENSGTEEDDDFSFRNNEDAPVAAGSDADTGTSTQNPAARSQRGTKLADKTNESQNLPAQKGKRAAATTLVKPAPAKKAKPAPLAVVASDDDSDDDDGLKFRFARRK
ncbi:hypothetical protein D0Z07_8660 [Hyphodiscus hymeniophilus]|uniref:FHA domain-containing protein n=1 Tax=Hyphodiscus hymeniophilus TaxID=353542 RepID=A0A9P6VD88_9HELO|nr:hypothetical protein D0Z07_8660 [Hyphodiscus hymeniophilus]